MVPSVGAGGDDGDQPVHVRMPGRAGPVADRGVRASGVAIHVRDSKDQLSPELALSPAAWDDFVSYAVQG
ncbi:DUF397 domain-containing protein [Streptomyces atratus]|nr:DUF397 domain-containing protein [Streptomyces atratus]WPW30535.1 DUF397 domain-containing protein [Streptomyces atratus]